MAAVLTGMKIGPVTIGGITFNTLHDQHKAILRIAEVRTADGKLVPMVSLVKDIYQHVFLECNQSTIKDAAHFKSLLDRDLILIYTTEGKLMRFPRIHFPEGTKAHSVLMQNGKPTPLIPKMSINLLGEAEGTKATYLPYATSFNSKMPLSSSSQFNMNVQSSKFPLAKLAIAVN